MEKNREPERLFVPIQDVYDHLMKSMQAALPRPATDRPEDIVRRENAAMAEVASMLPANIDEAQIAVLCVIASEHALDMLAQIRHGTRDALKDSAAATSMIRQSIGMRSLLLRVQAARMKREGEKVATKKVKLAATVAVGQINGPLVNGPLVNGPLVNGPLVSGGAKNTAPDAGTYDRGNRAGLRPAGWQHIGEPDPDDGADGDQPAKVTRVLH